MNFIKNCGLEYGIGMELLMIGSRFHFNLPTTPDETNFRLNNGRTNTATVNIPLHYVHRIELGNRLTLFPKIGVDAKILITNPNVGTGIYTDSLNNLNYSVGFETTQRYENGPFQIRIAYNWRDSFVRGFQYYYTSTSNEPVVVEDYSQIDISMSYDLTDNVSIFLEGINVTEEGSRIHGREKNHMFYVGEGVGRYALGVRASF